MTTKRDFIFLLKSYESSMINGRSFSNEYYKIYDLGGEITDASKNELSQLAKLGEIAGRYSWIEKDHKDYPGTYYTEEELRDAVEKTLNIIDSTP